MEKENLITQSSKKTVTGICALCEENSELQLSHRMPKAVGKIIKEHSLTKKFRNAANPEKPAQDLDKEYLLCIVCERRFSPKEGLFIQNVLRPFRNQRTKHFEYDAWLNYFITSVSWRTLYYDVQNTDLMLKNGFSEEIIIKIQSAEEEMRNFLLDESLSMKNIENHLIFLDHNLLIGDSKTIEYSRYCNAALGYLKLDLKSNSLYIFHILAGVLILTIIEKSPSEKYVNTHVECYNGRFSDRQCFNNSDLEFEILEFLPQQFKKSRNKLPKKIIASLEKKIKDNPEAFLKSSSSIRYREKNNPNKT